MLDDATEAGALAYGLFNYADQQTAMRTLPLSATPYKMYTLHSEQTPATGWARDALAYEWNHDEREANAEGWKAHVGQAKQVIEGWWPEAPPPDDLVELLAEVAVAGPATSGLRSPRDVTGSTATGTLLRLRGGPVCIGWIYRRVLNQIEAAVLIRGEYGPQTSRPYWRQILTLCAGWCPGRRQRRVPARDRGVDGGARPACGSWKALRPASGSRRGAWIAWIGTKSARGEQAQVRRQRLARTIGRVFRRRRQ